MLSAVALSLAGGSTAAISADTLPPAPLAAHTVGVPPTVASPPVGPVALERRTPPAAPPDSGRVQPVELSDWYYRRNTIHRVASYTMLPLFAAQYVSGRRVYADLANAPRWATRTHQAAATGVAALFAVNTVTGGVEPLGGAPRDGGARAAAGPQRPDAGRRRGLHLHGAPGRARRPTGFAGSSQRYASRRLPGDELGARHAGRHSRGEEHSERMLK